VRPFGAGRQNRCAVSPPLLPALYFREIVAMDLDRDTRFELNSLKRILNRMTQGKQTDKNMGRVFALFGFVIGFAAYYFYEQGSLPTIWWGLISIFAGISFGHGTAYVQTSSEISTLKPYVDLDLIETRINEIQEI
jgi:hypothetical protein